MTCLRATEPKTPESQARTARPYHHHRLPLPVSLQSLLCCSEAKCKDQRGERKARKGGAPGASRVHSKQIFKAGKRSHSNSSDLLTAQTGNDVCGGKVETAAAGVGVSRSAWAPTPPATGTHQLGPAWFPVTLVLGGLMGVGGGAVPSRGCSEAALNPGNIHPSPPLPW